MHLAEKKVVQDGQSTRIIRRHDQARTPFDRLCATIGILPEHQAQLEALRDQINPRLLRQQIYDGIDYIFSLPGAVPGRAEDIHQTLATASSSDMGGDISFHFSFNRTPIVQ